MQPVQKMPAGLWALVFGNLVIGTGVLVVFGSLNNLAESMNASIAQVGHIITAGAIVMCVAAPILATVIGSVNRRLLLAASMLWYAICLGVSALMPDYESLIVMRMLTVLSPALFTAQSAVCAGLMVPVEQRGKAITLVMLGWSLSFMLGVPMANWFSGHYGWSYAFAAVALAALISTVYLYRSLPDNLHPEALTLSDWRTISRHPLLLFAAPVVIFYSAGQFVLFAYLAPVLRDQIGLNIDNSSLILVGFGFCGVCGSLLSSQWVDRIGPARMVLVTMMMMAVPLGLWPLADNVWMAVAFLVPWGLVFIAVHAAQQARLIAIAPALASASMALSTSGMYIGQGLGAFIGGVIVDGHHPLWLGPTGMLIVVIGMIASVAISRYALRSPDATYQVGQV